MAAFSYKQHQPFLVDCAHVPFLPHQFEEMMSNASSSSSYSFLQYHAPDHHHHAITDHYFSGPEPETYEETTNTLDKARESLAALQTDFSKPEKKRKNIDGSCLTSLQSQKSKSRKQKKHKEGKKEKAAVVEMKEKKQGEEAPVGYIHVRARRGQATDSHSLAERVRREKISERMKLLQALVPGCDKVTGKAVMLDEIINYVQSLQNQIEFLSMKLASVSPMLYDFGVEFDGREMNQVEKMSSLTRIHQTCSPFHPNACHDQDTNSTPFLLHAQLPIISQENSGFLMGEQRQAFLNQVVDLSNKYNSLISAQLGM